MKDSDFFLMSSMIALFPHLSKGWGLFIWAVLYAGFLISYYLERFA